MKLRAGWLLILIVGMALVGACAPPDEAVSPAPNGKPSSAVEKPTPSGAPTTQPPLPAASVAMPPATREPQFVGFDFQISEGDFWDYRWSSLQRNCAQRSGCSTAEDSGLFQITLGQPKSIQGMTAYELILAGDSGSSVPPWRYIAVEDNQDP